MGKRAVKQGKQAHGNVKAFEGLWTLRAMDGSLTKDVEIVAAHEIVAFGQSKISEG